MQPNFSSKTLWQELKGLARLWPYLRPYRLLIVWGALLVPIISFLQSWRPFIMRRAVDDGITPGNYSVLINTAILFSIAVIFEYGARSAQSFFTALATHRMVRDLRSKLVTHVLRLPASFHDKNMSGALVTRSTSDFDNLNESLNQGVLTAIIDFAVLLGCVIGMYLLDAKLATAMVVLLPLVGWLIVTFSKMLKSLMLATRKCLAELNGFAQECLFAHSTIKLLNASGDVTKRFDNLGKNFRDLQMKSVIIDAFLFSLLDGIAAISIGIIFWIVAVYVFELEANGITAGLLIAFAQYAQQVFEPLKQLGNKVAMLQGAFTAIDRIFGLLDEREEVSGAMAPQNLKGHVRFEDVSFAYQSDRLILKNLSFDLPAGTSTALVGATGSGKSSTIKLLTKMYSGYTGRIFMDQFELAEVDNQQLRKLIGIVPQDIALFKGSVAFNISLGHPDVSPDQIKEAAALVGADKFIEQLPQKYDSNINEQGSNLSHGQRQLIAFARALARQPSLIILDEATSSIDPDSEQLIQTATEKLLKDRSVIIIAHRLSTIQRCDRILVLQDGQIVESGNHTELRKAGGAYAKLQAKLAKGESLEPDAART